ncbi:uncharacterized protein H6S33_000044 [Morchella sextelata]|uniref:uncharacterized protein n=1 Tax=Morchella sextelata TaxID=1174677 RepID=UPI001D03BAE3|nr:uncharacterized protein H6S33_000044 [Morchella sextelata]KAH0614408.1 hypothetical protein H6S33_000044 [Morchella sextelata]
MKISLLSIVVCLPALGFVAARPTAHAPAHSGSVYSYWDYMISEHSHTPITKRESRIVPVPKNENDKFLDRWTANFGTPAPEPVAHPPTTSRTLVGTLTSAADALFGVFGKGKDPEPGPYAHPPTRHADSSTDRYSKYAGGSTDRYSKYAASNVDDDAPPRYEDVFDTDNIVDWRADSPAKYAPSFLSDDETAGPSRYSYFGDDKKGMSGYSSSDDDEPFNPNGGSATNYWSELLAPETVVVMPGNPLTAEGLAEEIWRQADAGGATEEADYWDAAPKERSGWQKFLDWCKHAWNTVKGVFTKN